MLVLTPFVVCVVLGRKTQQLYFLKQNANYKMKVNFVASSLTLAAHPMVTLSVKSSSLMSDVDSTHKNGSFLEEQRRLFVVARPVAQKAHPDVGVLQGRRRGQRSKESSKPQLFEKHRKTRFLQDSLAASTQETTCLKPDTCEPELCACVANKGDAYTCAHELHAVCQGVTSQARGVDKVATWTIEGCVDERRLEYYENIYCPFAGCIATGGSYNECSCNDFYKPYCEQYGTQMAESACEIANCCASAGIDDAGRGICLDKIKLGEDPTTGPPLTYPNTANPSQGLAEAQTHNGTATPFGKSFGLSVSAFAIITTFFINLLV